MKYLFFQVPPNFVVRNIFFFRVFEDLRLTRHWGGDLLFLEDDVFVAPDFLRVLRKLRELASTTRSLVLNLGNLKQTQQNSDANKVNEKNSKKIPICPHHRVIILLERACLHNRN